MDTRIPFASARAGRRSAQVIQIDSSKHVSAVAWCAVVCGASVVLALVAAVLAWNSATEYRVVLNHTMELEAQQKAMNQTLEDLRHGK